ncbi:formate dehydrogenase, nitrate-inducible, major subunit [Actinobacillus equuli]|nr:formate dehydrogenase, nitrate-inducible, major subunit [Actinobacillus equuli]
MQVSRRKFFKICAGGMAGTSAAMLGFAPATALAALVNITFTSQRNPSNLHLLRRRLWNADVQHG